MTQQRRVLTLLAVVVVIGVLLLAVRPVLMPRDRAGSLQAAFDAEFLARPDGYPGLSEHYDFHFAEEPRQMDPGLMYRAVADGAVDVIDGFATDGRIPAYDLVTLEDDRSFFPPYDAAPLVRGDTLQHHPEIRPALNRLAGRISTEAMQKMNLAVDELGRKAADVAREFVEAEGLLAGAATPLAKRAGRIVVGSKAFTEQEILGEIMALLLESHTDLNVERRLTLGGTMICFEALRAGDLDVYAEYTGTALVNVLDRPVIVDSDESYKAVADAFRQEYDLVWLEPFGFNNTYTLTMRRTHAHRLDIHTISDLAERLSRSTD